MNRPLVVSFLPNLPFVSRGWHATAKDFGELDVVGDWGDSGESGCKGLSGSAVKGELGVPFLRGEHRDLRAVSPSLTLRLGIRALLLRLPSTSAGLRSSFA